jgi:hypothetical protein
MRRPGDDFPKPCAQNRYHQRVPRPRLTLTRLTSMSALLGPVALPKDVAVSFFANGRFGYLLY